MKMTDEKFRAFGNPESLFKTALILEKMFFINDIRYAAVCGFSVISDLMSLSINQSGFFFFKEYFKFKQKHLKNDTLFVDVFEANMMNPATLNSTKLNQQELINKLYCSFSEEYKFGKFVYAIADGIASESLYKIRNSIINGVINDEMSIHNLERINFEKFFNFVFISIRSFENNSIEGDREYLSLAFDTYKTCIGCKKDLYHIYDSVANNIERIDSL